MLYCVWPRRGLNCARFTPLLLYGASAHTPWTHRRAHCNAQMLAGPPGGLHGGQGARAVGSAGAQRGGGATRVAPRGATRVAPSACTRREAGASARGKAAPPARFDMATQLSCLNVRVTVSLPGLRSLSAGCEVGANKRNVVTWWNSRRWRVVARSNINTEPSFAAVCPQLACFAL